jgi:O-antigen/teichoic acid export membrane protein
LLAGLATSSPLRVAESGERVIGNALGNALLYCLAVGLVGTVVGIVVLPHALAHLGTDAVATSRLAVLAIPLYMLGEVVTGIDLALGRTRHYNAALVSGGATVVALNVGLVVARAVDPETVVGAALAGAAVCLGVAAHGLPWRRVTIALRELRRDLAYGARVFLTSILSLVNLRLDVILMTAFLGGSQIGWYSIAVSSMLPMTVVAAGASALITPAVARARGTFGGIGAHVAFVRRTALRYGALTLAIGGVLAASLPWALPLLFGKAFEPAVELAWILLPGFVAQGYAYIVDAGMIGLRKPWVGNAAQGIGMAFTVVMLPVLLPRYGAIGAAVTSSVAYVATAGVSVWALGHINEPAPTSAAGILLHRDEGPAGPA